jgi:hypothetical protein
MNVDEKVRKEFPGMILKLIEEEGYILGQNDNFE